MNKKNTKNNPKNTTKLVEIPKKEVQALLNYFSKGVKNNKCDEKKEEPKGDVKVKDTEVTKDDDDDGMG